jgi:hypothetical protein
MGGEPKFQIPNFKKDHLPRFPSLNSRMKKWMMDMITTTTLSGKMKDRIAEWLAA